MNNYNTPQWTFQDSEDLFRLVSELPYKAAISEFDLPQIVDLADKYGLSKIIVGERVNLKNRRIEMLYTNYSINQNKLF